MTLRSLIFWLCTILVCPLVGQTNHTADSLLQNRDTTFVTVLGSTELLQSALNSRNLLKGTEPELINALDQLPGIFKIHEAGFPLVYRGMSASRLRIERNGALRSGFVQQGYLLEDINPDNVSQLRIVKGAESVLYGTGGSGGVITIDENALERSVKSSLYLAYGSNAGTRTIGLKTGKKGKGLNWLLSGRVSGADDFNAGDGSAINNSARNQNGLNLSLQKSFSPTTLLTWNHDLSNGSIERPQGFQNNPFELRKYKNHYSYQSNFKAETDLDNGDRLEQNAWVVFSENDQQIRNFNGSFTELNVFENRNYTRQSFGYRVNWLKHSNEALKWRIGGDFISARMDQLDVRDNFINQVFDIVTFTQSRRENMGGLFGMAQLHKGKLDIDFSLRADMASIGNAEQRNDYTILSGGISLEWKANDRTSQNLSLTRQYRYPTQDESLGVIFGGRGIFRGNPDIKPEYSNQLEWSITSKRGHWEYAFSTWLSLFEDRISELFLGNGEFTYRNLSRARTAGFDARIDYVVPGLPTGDLAVLSLTGSLIRGDDLGTEGWFSSGEDPLIGIPPRRLRLSGRWQKAFSTKFSLTSSVDLEYIDDYDRLPSGTIRQTFAVQPTDGYVLLNLDLSGNLAFKSRTIQFGVRATNLTNSTYFPFGARIMGVGRDIRIYTRFPLKG